MPFKASSAGSTRSRLCRFLDAAASVTDHIPKNGHHLEHEALPLILSLLSHDLVQDRPLRSDELGQLRLRLVVQVGKARHELRHEHQELFELQGLVGVCVKLLRVDGEIPRLVEEQHELFGVEGAGLEQF